MHRSKWELSADEFPFDSIRKGRVLSQVKLLITNKAFCIVQRATAQSQTVIFRDYGAAKAPPGFKPAGLNVCIIFLSFCSFCLLT
jgi:hypothetical protein